VVHLADGTEVPYDGLVIATGASPRRLPGQPQLDGVLEVRTLADSVSLRDRIADGTAHVVIIGAGFIGLEVAATARDKGCTVTVLEGAPAPLIRGLGGEMGLAVASVHARNGVPVRCGVQVIAIEGDGTRVTGVRLADGELVPADAVVVGVGVVPATDWLENSPRATCWPTPAARPARRTARCRSSGATSSTAASSSWAAPTAATTCTCSPAVPTASSPRSTATRGACVGCSA
jgi:NADPH-dependent 2,4-dienoyl-CoA reductase/sulfur reductase-like enzyme